MMRKLISRACRLRIEREQNLRLADSKENVPSGLFGNHIQTKDLLIEIFGGVKVIDIDRRFNNRQHFHFNSPSNAEMQPRHGCKIRIRPRPPMS